MSVLKLDGRGFCFKEACQRRCMVLMVRAFRNAEKIVVAPLPPIPGKHLPEPTMQRLSQPRRTPSQERALRAAAEQIVRSTPW
jgi:hypothetical protein